jgi:hypothetical protein
MIVSVYVDLDGKIELTRHARRPQFSDELLFENNEEALKQELESYGAEEPRITEALKELETEFSVTI